MSPLSGGRRFLVGFQNSATGLDLGFYAAVDANIRALRRERIGGLIHEYSQVA
jgi:hypothetical protein